MYQNNYLRNSFMSIYRVSQNYTSHGQDYIVNGCYADAQKCQA